MPDSKSKTTTVDESRLIKMREQGHEFRQSGKHYTAKAMQMMLANSRTDSETCQLAAAWLQGYGQ